MKVSSNGEVGAGGFDYIIPPLAFAGDEKTRRKYPFDHTARMDSPVHEQLQGAGNRTTPSPYISNGGLNCGFVKVALHPF